MPKESLQMNVLPRAEPCFKKNKYAPIPIAINVKYTQYFLIKPLYCQHNTTATATMALLLRINASMTIPTKRTKRFPFIMMDFFHPPNCCSFLSQTIAIATPMEIKAV